MPPTKKGANCGWKTTVMSGMPELGARMAPSSHRPQKATTRR